MTNESYYTLNVSFVFLFPFQCVNTLFSFLQSYSCSRINSFVRNETNLCMSLLDLVIINKSCDTAWWDIFSCLLLITTILLPPSPVTYDILQACHISLLDPLVIHILPSVKILSLILSPLLFLSSPHTYLDNHVHFSCVLLVNPVYD